MHACRYVRSSRSKFSRWVCNAHEIKNGDRYRRPLTIYSCRPHDMNKQEMMRAAGLVHGVGKRHAHAAHAWHGSRLRTIFVEC